MSNYSYIKHTSRTFKRGALSCELSSHIDSKTPSKLSLKFTGCGDKKMKEVKAEGQYVIFDSRNLAGNKIFKARLPKNL